MATATIELKPTQEGQYELRLKLAGGADHTARRVTDDEIAQLRQECKQQYYDDPLPGSAPRNLVPLGRHLYDWLNGDDGWLDKALRSAEQGLTLRIDAQEELHPQGKQEEAQLPLAHLPWELLHDGDAFLFNRLKPWVTVSRRSADSKPSACETANRPLQLLFMACAPEDTPPVLDFEAEESLVLRATERQPIELTVEESGCLDELGHVVMAHEVGHFDVLHLTGHADVTEDGPRFYTESLTGSCLEASAEEIAEGDQRALAAPRLSVRLPHRQ